MLFNGMPCVRICTVDRSSLCYLAFDAREESSGKFLRFCWSEVEPVCYIDKWFLEYYIQLVCHDACCWFTIVDCWLVMVEIVLSCCYSDGVKWLVGRAPDSYFTNSITGFVGVTKSVHLHNPYLYCLAYQCSSSQPMCWLSITSFDCLQFETIGVMKKWLRESIRRVSTRVWLSPTQVPQAKPSSSTSVPAPSTLWWW